MAFKDNGLRLWSFFQREKKPHKIHKKHLKSKAGPRLPRTFAWAVVVVGVRAGGRL